MSRQLNGLYEFGAFRLDAAERILLRHGKPILLTPKAFDMLLALVQNRGHLVEKDHLMKLVWAEAFVEEANLARHIWALRKALREDEGGHGYIETVPKLGYRFVAQVRELSDEAIDVHSVAILPLVNASADPNMEYLGDGITESIINNLSQIRKLKVMARSTVFGYKNRDIHPQTVGRELGVDAVLAGRVSRLDNRLIVGAELIAVKDGTQLWGEQYRRTIADVIAIQVDISKQISDKLRLKLTGDQRKQLTRRYTDKPEAYESYLKGRYYWNKRTPEAFRKGLEYFQQAIELDTSYVLAYTGLADCYNGLSYYGALAPKQAYTRAKAAAEKALEIDDSLAEAHNSLAFARWGNAEWDWSGAETEFKRAIELNGAYSTAHHWYALVLAGMGRLEEALVEIMRARELDPLSLIINTHVGWILYLSRRYDEAIEQYCTVRDMDSNFYSCRILLGEAYVQQARYDEALVEFEMARNLSGESPLTLASFGHVYALAGMTGDAKRLLAELKELSKQRYVSAYHMATIATGLGQTNEAFAWLEQAYEERACDLIYFKVTPILSGLHQDPRYADLVRRLGLTP